VHLFLTEAVGPGEYWDREYRDREVNKEHQTGRVNNRSDSAAFKDRANPLPVEDFVPHPRYVVREKESNEASDDVFYSMLASNEPSAPSSPAPSNSLPSSEKPDSF
jgi:hypothetical protein